MFRAFITKYYVVVWVFLLPGVCVSEVEPQKLTKKAWVKLEAPGFTIISDEKPKNVKHFAEELEKFRAVIQVITGVKLVDNDRPVKIIASKRKHTFATLLGNIESYRNFRGIFTERESGVYSVIKLDGGSRDDDPFRQTSKQVLFHEYAHYVMSLSASVSRPLWFEEGMAQFLSTTSFKKNNQVHVGRIVGYHVKNLRYTPWGSVEDLLKAKTFDSSKKRKMYWFYAKSWLLVHYCMIDDTRRNALVEYMRLTQSGVSVDEAFSQAFKTSYSAFDKKVSSYVNNDKFRALPFVLKDDVGQNLPAAVPMSHEEVYFEVGEMLLNAFSNRKSAMVMFEQTLKENPNNTDAMAGIANIEMFSDSAKAKQTIDKAYEISPDNIWVNTIRGHVYKKLALNDDPDNQAEHAAVAKAAFSKAINGGDGINVEAMLSAGNLYQGLGDPERAKTILSVAKSYAPTEHLIRSALISVHFALGEVEAAENIISEIKMDPHRTAEKDKQLDEWADKLRRKHGVPLKGGLQNDQKRSNESIRQVMEKGKSKAVTHYFKALEEDASISGTIIFSATILPDGSVTKVTLISSELNNKDLESKILTVIKSLEFGAMDVEPLKFKYKFKFIPGNQDETKLNEP